MAIKFKTNEEIEILQVGGHRHKEILDQLALMVVPGVSTMDLEERARALVAEGGDEPAFLGYQPRGAKVPYPAVLCVSINDEIVHGIPSKDRIIREGDLVSIDLGLTHGGLITDSAVTVPAGKVSEEAKALLATARRALEAGLSAVKLGGHVGDIGSAISGVVDQSPFTLSADLSGHGVGYGVHEDPFVPNFGTEGEGPGLKAGMVIAVEPMLNAGKEDIKVAKDGYTISTRDGSMSAHFEHTVAITDKGTIILTS